MRCLLTVHDARADAWADVLVDAPPGLPVAALAEALQRERVAGPGPLRADGAALDLRAPLASVLRDGLVLVSGGPPAGPAGPAGGLLEEVAPEPDAPAGTGGAEGAGEAGTAREVPGVELRAVGGPDAGRAWRLRPGRYLVGRGEEAAVRLGADPQVSRRHAALRVDAEGIEVEDLDAANQVLLAGAPVRRARLEEGAVVQLGETLLAWARPPRPDAVVAGDGEGHVVLNRPPRILPEPVTRSVALPVPAARPPRPAFSYLGAAVPLLAGVAMALALGQPAFLLFAVLSPLAGLANHLGARRTGSKAHRLEQARAADAARAAEAGLRRALDEEAAERRRAAPDPAEVASLAAGPRARLWERRRGDPDFCHLRLGLADLPPHTLRLEGRPVPPPGATGSGDDGAPLVRQVPAVLDLPAAGVLGVAGPEDARRALARSLVVQACGLHAPDDLQLALLSSAGDPAPWSWLAYLPHARPGPGGLLARVAVAPPATEQVAGALAQLVDERLRRLEAGGTERVAAEPLVLVVLDGAYDLRASPAVARCLRRGPEVGVVSLALDETEALLPEECTTTAVFGSAAPTRCALRASGAAPVEELLADLVGAAWTEAVARALAPVRCSAHGGEDAALPASVRLLELLGLDPPRADALARRWSASDGAPVAVLGRTGLGPLAVDLRRDGPHGLVAGTTGAGKSELLQSLVAGLVATVPPDALNLVLVDYKGGAAFKEAARLPHTVGMVTDLDGHLTGRALASLAAELRRRERLFRSAGASDLDDYWLATGNEPGRRRLPRLLIVVDELAALVDELPGFVDGLVDLARRGRSLGIHLVLATQRPSGVVSPAIRTNTNLRVALRVTDAADSLDVVDAPLAAQIRKEAPGRAFLRVGHDRLVELQTARVSGRAPRRGEDDAPGLFRVRWEDAGGPVGEDATGGAEAAPAPSDLALLVDAARRAADDLRIPPGRSPWLEPLPERLTLDELPRLVGAPVGEAAPGAAPLLAFGLEDRPAEQARAVAGYDLAAGGHLLVAGDAGSGRSSLLRAIAVSASRALPPDQLHCYGLDGGNGALGPLEALPHCGAVVSRLEPERVERLLVRLADEVVRRHQLLARGGFASLEDARRAAGPGGAPVPPYLLLLVDRYEGFAAAFEAHDGGRLVAGLHQLLREGASAGLRVVVAGDRSVLAGRLPSLVDATVVLRLHDRSGYALAGLHPGALPETLPPGRGLWAPSGVELQVGLLAADASGPAQAAALLEAARAAAAAAGAGAGDAAPDGLPEPIGVLPAYVALSGIDRSGTAGGGGRLLVGVGGDRVAPIALDLTGRGGFLVAGPPRSGRSNLLCVLARSLLDAGRDVLAVCPRPSGLASLEGLPGLRLLDAGRLGAEDAAGLVEDLGPGAAVLVDDAPLLEAPRLTETLARVARVAGDTGRLLVAAGPPADLAVALRGFLPELRRARAGVVLCPQAPSDGEALGVRLPHSLLAAGPPGRGVLAVDGLLTALQVPLDDGRSAGAALRH